MENLPIVLTHAEYKQRRKSGITSGEINNEPSETIQGQAMPMAEIIQRFSLGQTLTNARNTYYDSDMGDVDFDSYSPTESGAFDLADASQMLEAENSRKEMIKRKQERKETERSGEPKAHVQLESQENLNAEENKKITQSPPPPPSKQ